jgi:MFS family permease
MSATFRSLRHRNARRFFVGLLVSNVGTWLQLTASGFLVNRLTGRAIDIGITVALQFLPMLVLGAWAGAVADRHDRRTLTLVTQSLLAAQALVLGVLDVTGVVNLQIVFLMSFVLGVVNAFDNPARRGLVTELVDPSEIPNALALNTAVMTGSRIFGPALAALLVGPLGTGWLFILNGVSFTAILLSLTTLDVSRMHVPPAAPRGGTPVRDALRYVADDRRLLTVFVVFAVVSTFAFNYNVSLLRLADSRWGSEEAFGWLLAVTSVGSLAGSLAIARLGHVTLRTFALSATLLGACNVALAWAPNLLVAFALAVPLGFGGAGFIAGGNVITQQGAPPDMRGRLLALTAVAFLGSTPIGGPITGWIADNVSDEWSLAYGGVITLMCVAVLVAIHLTPRRAPRHSPPPSRSEGLRTV